MFEFCDKAGELWLGLPLPARIVLFPVIAIVAPVFVVLEIAISFLGFLVFICIGIITGNSKWFGTDVPD